LLEESDTKLLIQVRVLKQKTIYMTYLQSLMGILVVVMEQK